MRLRIVNVPTGPNQWLTERIGYRPTNDFKAIAAVRADGRILGMVGFDSWTKSSAAMHMAIESPIALRALFLEPPSPAFDYPFKQLELVVH